jgi:hypothetical protein
MINNKDYIISEYQKSYSSFDPYPNLSPLNYKVNAGSMSLSTDPRTANQLQEVSNKLSTGIKGIEVEGVSPEILESIPIGHLKEINRLTKLTGTQATFHGPVIEPSGMSNEGYDESQRKSAEIKMQLAIERAYELNPKKSSPVTFHSSVQIPTTVIEPSKEGKKEITIFAVNKETGKTHSAIKEEEYFSLQSENLEKGKIYSARKQLDILNNSEWEESLNNTFFNQERANEILKKEGYKIQNLLSEISSGKIDLSSLGPEQKRVWENFLTAENYLKSTHKSVDNLFNKAYKFGDEKQKQYLKIKSEEFKKEIQKDKTIMGQSKLMQKLINDLYDVTPKIYTTTEEFALDKTAETFSNVALYSYKKYKENAPIVSIENPPYGTVLSSGEELKKLIDESRKKFIEKAIKEGISKSDAGKYAEKLIGVTWDVGHINMMRNKGFGKEEIIKQSEKIAPVVKHVHFSDNFGLEHTELPMGMGNVPIKEIMEKLGKEGFEAKKVIEAANWFQHFKEPPIIESFGAFGSQIYTDGTGPYWNQTLGFSQNYNLGLTGQWLPQINYETFGAGFSQLPTDLGGKKSTLQGSRMSGKSME